LIERFCLERVKNHATRWGKCRGIIDEKDLEIGGQRFILGGKKLYIQINKGLIQSNLI